jgi:hypothetical protein
MHRAFLDVQSFISLFIIEVLGWRRIPEELSTQLSDYKERGKKTSIEMKTIPIPAVSFSGWGSESIPGVYVLRPAPQLPHGESKWIMRGRWM